MAVDTQTKRRSVAGMTLMFLVIAPLADGTIAAVDRMHITGLYAGIDPGGVAPGIQTDTLHIFSTADVEPEHISDSGDNILVAGDVEVAGTIYAGGSSITGSDINVTTITSAYTVTASDDTIIATGTFTVTVPASAVKGKVYDIKNKGTGTITLTSSALIDEAASISLTQYVSARIVFDGITWWKL